MWLLTSMLMLIPTTASAQLTHNTFMFLKGEGTSSSPYLIDSYEALVEFREQVAIYEGRNNGYGSQDIYGVVTADIDMGDDPNWAPIRNFGNRTDSNMRKWFFHGDVDGRNHTISHLNINKRIDAVRTDAVYLGLFGRNNGTYTLLKNIKLEDAKVDVTLEEGLKRNLDIHVGTLIGYSNSVIKNIQVNGEISLVDESTSEEAERNVCVGGVIGKASNDGYISYLNDISGVHDLHADVNIVSNALGSSIGGIAGLSDSIYFQNCTSSGILVGRECNITSRPMASTWRINVGGICGKSIHNQYVSRFKGLSSVCRVSGGSYAGGLFGYIYAEYAPLNSVLYLTDSYAAGAVSDAYFYSGGLVGFIQKNTSTNVSTNFDIKNCYYAGTLAVKPTGTCATMIGNYTGNSSFSIYQFVNCFYDKKMAEDNTDYQTLLGVGTPESMPAYIYGYNTTDIIGTNTHFGVLVDEDQWIFSEGRYPQLKALKDTRVSTLAAVPIFFIGNEDNAERVYQGASLSEATVDGVKAVWSAPMGYGSIMGETLVSNQVGYEVLTLTAGHTAKRLNLYMAYSDVAWEGEDHIPTGSKAEVFPYNTGTRLDPYLIMNAGQLAYALKNNEAVEYYQLGRDIIINKNLLADLSSAIPWIDTKKAIYTWKAHLNGNGFLVHGMYLPLQSTTDYGHYHGLLGKITGQVGKMGVVESVITDDFSSIGSDAYVGAVAGSVESGATLEDCFATGYMLLKEQGNYLYAGGLCGMAKGTLTDCLNAVSVLADGNRMVMAENNHLGGVAGCASGAVFQRCVNIGRVSYYDNGEPQVQGGICPGASFTATDCLYDTQMSACAATTVSGVTGLTTTEMSDGSRMKGKSRWVVNNGFYPLLADFEATEYMKLVSQPVCMADADYSAKMRNILELPVGSAKWSQAAGDDCLTLYEDYGLAEPKAQGTARLMAEQMQQNGRDKAYNVVFVTIPADYVAGIQFVDPTAEQACVDAFGAGGVLTLSTAMAVTDFSAFINHGSTPDIVRFPEMRYFTGITRLTDELSTCSAMQEVGLPLGLKTIGVDAFSGCGSLQTVTVPVALTKVEPYAFRDSQVKEILVDKGNRNFVSRDGVLFDNKEYIVVYPPKREGTSYMYTSPLSGIHTSAFQNVEHLEKLYIGDDEGRFIDLRNGAIPTTGLQVFVNDATDNSDYIDQYRYDDSRDWVELDDEGNLHRYYPLNVTSARYATMCIYFDTQLPQGLTAYYCYEEDDDERVLRFKSVGRLVPNGLPVLIRGSKAAIYPLTELDGVIEAVYSDQLDVFQGSGEHGFMVGDQSESSGSNMGSILTLGRNSGGVLGFYAYRSSTNRIPPYRAYFKFETLSAAKGYTFSLEEVPTEIDGVVGNDDSWQMINDNAVYTLDGRKVADTGSHHSPYATQLPKGVYIYKGRKIVIK